MNPLDITQCMEVVVPTGWTCDNNKYGDASWSCDAGCGVLDSDCSSSTQSYYTDNCPSGQKVNRLDITQCIVVPAGWTCNVYNYGDGYACDGGCGVLDPDCSSSTDTSYSSHCPSGQMVNPSNILQCIPIVPLQRCYCDGDGDFSYKDLVGYYDYVNAVDCSTYANTQCGLGTWIPQSAIK
jgi:hypothetical protein